MMFKFEFLDEDPQERRLAQQPGGYLELLQNVSPARKNWLQWSFRDRGSNQTGLLKSQSNL
jgi:hypothetical protein